MSSYCCSIPPQSRFGSTIGMERSGRTGLGQTAPFLQGCPLAMAPGPEPDLWKSGFQVPPNPHSQQGCMAPALDCLSPRVESRCPLLAITGTATPITRLPGGRPSSHLPSPSVRVPGSKGALLGAPESKNVLGLTDHSSEFSSPLFRATCSYCPQTMRGQSGEKQSRSYRRKVTPHLCSTLPCWCPWQERAFCISKHFDVHWFLFSPPSYSGKCQGRWFLTDVTDQLRPKEFR